jgi:hypothetical protein
MQRFSKFRNTVGIVLTSTCLVAGGVVVASSAYATSTPKLTVTPSINLTNGKVVTVSGTGFVPGDLVFVVECLRTSKDQTGCNISNVAAATITESGTMPPTQFKIKTGKIGNGFCGNKIATIRKCDISVGKVDGTDSAVYPIVFKKPKK